MIDEPYRWVEAISNRREYIENELATGSPTIGLSFSDGLLLTFGRSTPLLAYEIRQYSGCLAFFLYLSRNQPLYLVRTRLTQTHICSKQKF
jgi:hypothetical protein